MTMNKGIALAWRMVIMKMGFIMLAMCSPSKRMTKFISNNSNKALDVDLPGVKERSGLSLLECGRYCFESDCNVFSIRLVTSIQEEVRCSVARVDYEENVSNITMEQPGTELFVISPWMRKQVRNLLY